MARFQRVLIIGASSGIGKALAQKFLFQGSYVAMLARRPSMTAEEIEMLNDSSGPRAFVYRHDVTEFEKTEALFQNIVQELGGLDLMIYCAGISYDLGIHEFDFQKDRRTIEVNLLGACAWLNESARYFEHKKSGTIVGISSVAGERGRPENPPYIASKAALTAFLESLRNRLWKSSVQVVTIKPGFVDTGIVRKRREQLWIVSADRAAELIVKAINARKKIAYIPGRWRIVSALMHLLPSFIFKRIAFPY